MRLQSTHAGAGICAALKLSKLGRIFKPPL
jgi:hypothetical protein